MTRPLYRWEECDLTQEPTHWRVECEECGHLGTKSTKRNTTLAVLGHRRKHRGSVLPAPAITVTAVRRVEGQRA